MSAGQDITITAKDVMTTNVVSIKQDVRTYYAMDLMVKHGIGGLPVVDIYDHLVGVVSEYDLLVLLCDCEEIESDLVEDYMTVDVRRVGPDADLKELAEIFRAGKLRLLPVTKNGKVVGIVSRHDLVRKLHEMRRPTSSELKAHKAAAAAARTQLNCHALLVEDGLANTRFLAQVLKNVGSRVTLAGNGRIAVEMVEKTLSHSSPTDSQPEPFDIVLMDMDMPVMDGYEATSRIRKIGFAAPIIAVTGRTEKYDRQRCFDAGCNDFLSKPYERTKLLGMISEHLKRAEQESKKADAATRIEEQPMSAASVD